MNKCPICNRNIHEEEPFSLMFSEKKNQDIYCCEVCEKQYNALIYSTKASEVKNAINYFYTGMKNVEDEELHDFLQEMIEDNADSLEEMEVEQKTQTKQMLQKQGGQKQQSGDYFQARSTAKAQEDERQDFGWISFLQIVSWIGFFALVVAGLILAVPMSRYDGGTALAILVGCIVGGLIMLAASMVFLGMAEDIRRIRRKLEK